MIQVIVGDPVTPNSSIILVNLHYTICSHNLSYKIVKNVVPIPDDLIAEVGRWGGYDRSSTRCLLSGKKG